MNALQSVEVLCPYCASRLDILVDCSVPAQDYIEDCAVCCRPIRLRVAVHTDGAVAIEALHEDDC